MIARLTADLLVLIHLGFIVFVVFGGLFVIKWNRLAWLHLPCACWGALVEISGIICPLTPLENRLRAAAHKAVYTDSFVEHYILPVIYPAQLTRHFQLVLAAGVILINLLLYGIVIYRKYQKQQ